MNTKAVFLGLVAAIGLGFLLTRRAAGQGPAPKPDGTEPDGIIPIPTAPPGEPVTVPASPVARTTTPVWYARQIPAYFIIETVSDIPTDWDITLRIYSTDGLKLEITRRLTWTSKNAPAPTSTLVFYENKSPGQNWFYVTDITLDVKGYGSPFILRFGSMADKGTPVWYKRINTAGQYAEPVLFSQ